MIGNKSAIHQKPEDKEVSTGQFSALNKSKSIQYSCSKLNKVTG